MNYDAEHLQELYAARAIEPLGVSEDRELRALEDALGRTDDHSFDTAVAAVALAGLLEFNQPLPDSLRVSLVEDGQRLLAKDVSRDPRAVRRTGAQAPLLRRVQTGWMAAAVCLVLAVFGWMRSPQTTLEVPVPTTPRVARETLLTSASDAVQLDWSATEDVLAGGATGDVVWSNTSQLGYMSFQGLPVNDPTENQYQLWIFDQTRSDEYPIDGGVFDVTAEGEVVVPIDAKLQVREPTLFAVTLEAPGGVVRSDREHLLLLASVTP